MKKLIRHIIVVWDESEHLSQKRSKELSEIFWRYYTEVFPDGSKTAESPMIVSTQSPIIPDKEVQSFLHKGQFIPYKGENKDLAIVKYCSTGFVDQNERYRFLPDELRNARYGKGDPPLLADTAVLVVFVTSDLGKGMTEALDYVRLHAKNIRTNFVSLRIKKTEDWGKRRIAQVGQIVGQELRKSFIKLESDSLLLELEK
jgi:hypothetical protein